jgi:hypothetical protein
LFRDGFDGAEGYLGGVEQRLDCGTVLDDFANFGVRDTGYEVADALGVREGRHVGEVGGVAGGGTVVGFGAAGFGFGVGLAISLEAVSDGWVHLGLKHRFSFLLGAKIPAGLGGLRWK